MTTFYDFSGGMESAAMLVVERERIREMGAIVRWVDTGKQLPEMQDSVAQIEDRLGLEIVRVPTYITFDEFLFERGGMVKQGTTDCSRRMKRANLKRHMKEFPKPWEINLGFNNAEIARAEDFTDRNERPWCHWRFPLIEANISRADTWTLCRDAGFSILIDAYEKYGRFDCFMCGNQTEDQVRRLHKHRPELTAEWAAMERRKGHSFKKLPVAAMVDPELALRYRTPEGQGVLGCACFGGADDFFDGGEA